MRNQLKLHWELLRRLPLLHGRRCQKLTTAWETPACGLLAAVCVTHVTLICFRPIVSWAFPGELAQWSDTTRHKAETVSQKVRVEFARRPVAPRLILDKRALPIVLWWCHSARAPVHQIYRRQNVTNSECLLAGTSANAKTRSLNCPTSLDQK